MKKLATEDSVEVVRNSIPTKVSDLTNDAGYLTEHQDLTAYATKTYADNSVSTHNTNASAHNDIRDLISGLSTRLNALADSDDTTLDQMSEIVAYIKANKSLIDSVTTSKVNTADIVNNLTTNVATKPLSAAQGVALKTLIDELECVNSNLVNGSTNGSLRSIGSAAESDEYTMGNNAFAVGINTMAHGPSSHAEGYGTKALYQSAHAEGQQTSAANVYTHAEGYWTRATGRISHAEGENTLASGQASHASGYRTIADGRSMTSIGECNLPSLESAYILQSSKINNQIIGTRTSKVTVSNTEPVFSNLDGSRSWIDSTRIDASAVRAGMYVEVGSNNYHIHVSSVSILGSMVQVSGTKYEPVDCGTSRSDIAFVVGNGFTEDPSNAYTLDWSGNGWFAGDVYVGSTSGTNKDEGSKKLATEDFVTAALTALGLPVPTAADAGKILRVNAQGKYELVSIANAEEATF